MGRYGLPEGYDIEITNRRGTERVRNISAYKGEMRVTVYDSSNKYFQREFNIPPKQPSLEEVIKCIEGGIRDLFENA